MGHARKLRQLPQHRGGGIRRPAQGLYCPGKLPRHHHGQRRENAHRRGPPLRGGGLHRPHGGAGPRLPQIHRGLLCHRQGMSGRRQLLPLRQRQDGQQVHDGALPQLSEGGQLQRQQGLQGPEDARSGPGHHEHLLGLPRHRRRPAELSAVLQHGQPLRPPRRVDPGQDQSRADHRHAGALPRHGRRRLV